MNKWPQRLHAKYLPRIGLWTVAFVIALLVALNTSTSWAAPVLRPLNQTVPTQSQIYMPLLGGTDTRPCDITPNTTVCNLNIGYPSTNIRYAWSPTGRVAFAKSFYGEGVDESGLYEMNDQGADRRYLLNLNRIEFIRYSPDGTMIALVVARPVDNEYMAVYDLYVYTFETGEARLLSDATNQEISYLAPNWSPDSGKLVFTRYQHSNAIGDIYTIRPDGSELTQLTNTPSSEHLASYSPDGTRIVYTESQGGDPSVQVSIAVMNADGSNPTNLTHELAPFTNNPVWSADGNSIFFFTSTVDDVWDIYKINADGTDPVNLTNDALQQDVFALSPDGSKILFVERTDPDAELIDIYTMNVDGSNITRHANPHGKGTYPSATAWHPDGQRVSYITFAGGLNLYLMRVE